jgi:hypothetical protein
MSRASNIRGLVLAAGCVLVLAAWCVDEAGADEAGAAEPDKRAEEFRLAEQLRRNPADYETTYRYVTLASELRDYEAAIGALERLLMFNPNLARAHKELGFLYARLGAYSSASLHLHKALDSPDLEAAQKAQIEAQLPDIDKQRQASRFFGGLHVGLRAQSNANYFPSSGLFQVGGIQTGSPATRQSDVNAFALGQISHDYDFQTQGGDVFESRGSVYATRQFSLHEYDVAVFGGSVGPRLAVAPETIRGLFVKPYVTGLVSLLGGVNYLNAGGGGLTFRSALGDALVVEPGVEWRRLYVNQGNLANGDPSAKTLATIATGDVTSGFVGGSLRLSDSARLEGRAAYSRASAYVASQSSNQLDFQAMLRLEVDPPFREIPRRWTIAPYARFTQLAFDVANPAVDPFRARRDDAWTYGMALDAPITPLLGFSGHLEFLRNYSNITSYQMQNVSVTFGPTARF